MWRYRYRKACAAHRNEWFVTHVYVGPCGHSAQYLSVYSLRHVVHSQFVAHALR